VLQDGFDPGVVSRAASVLAAGGFVAFPTETVYGLGARADDDAAVAGIFRMKGRPADHPLIVHVLGAAEASLFAGDVPAVARRLMDAFWPGPLTLIVQRAPPMARAAAAGQASIGLRCPSHPVARALLAAAARLGVPGVAAPSANRFGRISPTQAAHVVAEFGDELTVLDGGACEFGLESAIVDCSRGRPVLLRPGSLARPQIERAAGEPLQSRDTDAPRTSGTLEAHYAPRAKLRLFCAADLRAALARPVPGGQTVAVYSRTVTAHRPALGGSDPPYRAMPGQAAQAGRELFSVLRELDAEGVQLIWVEEPPTEPEWDGVRDRLSRAAAS